MKGTFLGQLAIEPCPGVSPVRFHGPITDSENRGDFLGRKTGKKLQLDYRGRPFVGFQQTFDRAIERDEFVAAAFAHVVALKQRHTNQSASVPLSILTAGIINQNMAHFPRGHSQKGLARHLGKQVNGIEQPQKCLVYQFGSLQRVPRPLPAHQRSSHAAEFGIDLAEKTFKSSAGHGHGRQCIAFRSQNSFHRRKKNSLGICFPISL